MNSNIINPDDLSKRLLLIIEDNELNREMLCEILSDRFRLLLAVNGQEGLELLKQYYRDLSVILLDVQMPIMDGYEFLRQTQSDPLLSAIPVIVTTGSTNADEEERCLSLGASDFVAKPYNPPIVLCRISNIIKLRESASTLSEIEFDDRTGIYTRQAFFHHATEALRANPDVHYVLTVSDIVDFPILVERYGEEAGADMLRRNAQQLRDSMPPSAIFGRYKAEQMVCMMPMDDPAGSLDLLKASARIVGPTGMPCHLKFGACVDIDHNVPISVHCQCAVAALKTILHQYGQTVANFDEALRNKLDRQQIIEETMESGLEDEQFKVYYQPKHDSRSGRLVGAEALIRWVHPTYGFMPPGEFIPHFERTGFITETDLFMWRRTCENQRRWLDEGLPIVPISVNCSRRAFLQPDFYDRWIVPVNDTQVPTQYLHLEVTESLFTDHMDEMVNTLQRCRELGIKIELDDFGTGYSSLNALGILPLDIVKLDMSFMREIDDERKARVMAASVKLIRNLNMLTVAEGVETEHQREIVCGMSVDMVQGYYYSKPLPQEEFLEYLKKQQSNEATNS